MLSSKQTLRIPHFTPHSINSTWMFEVFGRAGENALSPFLTESASERVVERQNERLSFLIDSCNRGWTGLPIRTNFGISEVERRGQCRSTARRLESRFMALERIAGFHPPRLFATFVVKELRLPLPAGLAYARDGQVVRYPDEEVQARLLLLFAKFGELLSAKSVMRYFQRSGLQLPVRPLRGPAPHEVVCRPTSSARGGSQLRTRLGNAKFPASWEIQGISVRREDRQGVESGAPGEAGAIQPV
jgi:hypothetical protein